ncbi:hypothetical protein [Kitasatospora sp. MAP5-34]|uniref:hypothetical protein n=1 Tax=Kitasatospora sp. MAP5-34 TaxID=3035102 RepID=UPI002473CD1B|nr:hypothetical protein [Kitasatospora sp. MAP5-34]MDH6580436.1 hypothetical protein [Kitasatospora sp. MAP5-34]
MPEHQLTASPRDFLCEHTPSKSRVLALLSHDGGPDSLQAVLTCRDPELAHCAAELLRRTLSRAAGVLHTESVDGLCGQLPDAPASSLRQAVAHVLAGTWPVAAGTLIAWPEGSAHEEPDQEDGVDSEGGDNDAAPESGAPARGEARLRDLPGQVVRIATLREFHVHDRQALLDAAGEQGWEPMPADQLDDDDPHDVVGAVMWLADPPVDVDGADALTERSHISLLRRNKGDEVAEWSAEPVVADFGPGPRAAKAGEPPEHSLGEELPDFAALFPVEPPHCEDSECEEVSCLWQLTPRTADLLHTALSLLADEAYEDAEELGDGRLVPDKNEGNWGVFPRLPKLTFATDLQWRRRFARAADDLADDLERGQWPRPTCTAEELALHLAIDDAGDSADELGDDSDGTGHGTHSTLPVHRDDYDFGACTDMFFQDTDVLMLYNSRFDGIEDPDGDANRQLGVGDLRAQAWFEPFGNITARDPHRGFRR